MEYDVALEVYTPDQSYIQEVTSGANSQLVWQMNIIGQLAYRGFRIPSLYPGVSWSQAAITAANAAAQPALTVASAQIANSVSLIVTPLPTAWIGAKLWLAQSRQPASAERAG